MTTQELQDRAAKAERHLRSVGDQLTIERLTAFVTECRAKIQAMVKIQTT